MFYLVAKTDKGLFELVDFSESQKNLLPQLTELQNENPASQPVVYDDKALRAGFLVDGFCIVALENQKYLIPLDEL
ncbi:hypothetical protein D3C75_1189960 [compost metagenome]